MIFVIVIVILIIDQLSKFIVSNSLSLHQSIPVIKNVVSISLVHNRGAAFGLLKNQVPLFIFSALLAVGLIFFYLRKNNKKYPLFYKLALALIVAGALGNLIDRILWGYVIDFIDFGFWPVFNIADSSITVGSVLLAYTMLKTGKLHHDSQK